MMEPVTLGEQLTNKTMAKTRVLDHKADRYTTVELQKLLKELVGKLVVVEPRFANHYAIYTYDYQFIGYIPNGTLLVVTDFSTGSRAMVECLYNNEPIWISAEALVYAMVECLYNNEPIWISAEALVYV